MSDFQEMMRGEAYEARTFKRDRHAKPEPRVDSPPNRAEHPGRKVDKVGAERRGGPGGRYRSQDITCRWCGGTGDDPHFGGSTDTCQSCGGYGIETIRTKVEE